MKTFDYSGLSANNATVKEAVKLFRANSSQVLDVSVDPKEKTRAGIKFKSLVIAFADGQRVDLLIKSTGDVFEVKINGRSTPMREQDAADGAVKEIAEKLAAGRKRFVAAQQKEKSPALPAGLVSRVSQLQALTGLRDGLKKEVEALEAELAA
jgi:hypothetical protein